MRLLPVSALLLTLSVTANCGFHYISSLDIKARASDGLRLISVSDDARPSWKTETELMELKRSHTAFVDVTDVYHVWRKLPSPGPARSNGRTSSQKPSRKYPKPLHQDELSPILDSISIEDMRNNLETLTSFTNRWYLSASGLEASQWIFERATEIVNERGRDDVTVSKFNHTDFPQPSIITRIHGQGDGPVTIVGCHLDSVNVDNPLNGTSPGADDDGSGVVNLLEALRALLAADFKPATPVEFHWYAAEEAGLRGSAQIATYYKVKEVEVQGMMQLDMTGYFKPGSDRVVALVPDFVDQDLNEFVKSLVTEYNSIPWVDEEPCKYGCSDHYSWHRVGYPVVYPFEAITGDHNPEMHTTKDSTDLDGFSWDHSQEFVKLAIAFVFELSAESIHKAKATT
ncbi:aminopeptidase [Coprinopsis sp. MPI-PUGE-AT-0042]|nr:aminopeptidase [Coprinopsis sp. MPI-PUGE-AT-0042]